MKQRREKDLGMKRVYALLFLFFGLSVSAQEIVALLKQVQNNHTLHMKYQQTSFVCKPYGVQNVSEIVLKTDINSSCRKYIEAFREENPKEKFFAISSLYVEQQYSVEGIEGECLLSLSSGHSYSEALLENGYARLKPGVQYKESELKERFERAAFRAQNRKVGIWSDSDLRSCLLPAE